MNDTDLRKLIEQAIEGSGTFVEAEGFEYRAIDRVMNVIAKNRPEPRRTLADEPYVRGAYMGGPR